MRLVKNGDVFISEDEAFISAYKENGYVEEEEAPKKTTKKATKSE